MKLDMHIHESCSPVGMEISDIVQSKFQFCQVLVINIVWMEFLSILMYVNACEFVSGKISPFCKRYY